MYIGLACAVQSLGQVHQGAQPQVMCKALHLCAVGQGTAEVFGGFIAQVLLQLLHQGLGLRLWCALLLAQIHLRHQAVAARLRLFALGLGGVAQPCKASQGRIELLQRLLALAGKGADLPQRRLQFAVQQQAGHSHRLPQPFFKGGL